jgi:cytoskeletal protein RodZ
MDIASRCPANKFVVSLVAIALVGSVIFVVLLELFVGGGAGTQQDNQSQGSKAEQPKKEGASNRESVEGVVSRSVPDKRTVIVKPDDGERQPFTYKPDKVKLTLDGKEAGPDAIDKGQRATIKYKKVTTKKDREVNVAKSIELESKKGSSGDE